MTSNDFKELLRLLIEYHKTALLLCEQTKGRQYLN